MSYQILSHCERITDTGINHLIDGPCGETLQVLELDNCPLVTDDTLERLRYITNLLLDSKMSLSLLRLLRSCRSLNRVEVFDCQQISRLGIQRLQVRYVAMVTIINLWFVYSV